ncbi:NUDIX hydrolase [Alteribacter natronophilus]|uniref:NUDIX hydrolase n=1 Tax=Alteribacter natronophilus TaxID=2583810 RepID=UPI00110D93BA|nr:NUDIX hydrolase [Alteribacter natronophilus]TMW71401.1 NUDIX hydrolase [Alteribacter natronophilus]
MNRVDVTHVLLFDDTGEQILMVKNIGSEGSYFTLPGGAVEAGEWLEDAAVREVREETGLEAAVYGIADVQEAYYEDSGNHAVFFTFFGRILGGKMEVVMPDEIEEVVWMKLHEAEAYARMKRPLGELYRESCGRQGAAYQNRGKVAHKG